MIRRGWWMLAALVAAVLATGMALANPASADIGYVPSPDSGATVSHLDLIARHGNIGVTLTVGLGDKVDGVTVNIPAAGGTWTPAASVTIGRGVLICTGGGGTDLGTDPLYYCVTPMDPHRTEFHLNLKPGRYIVSLPISRPTGSVRGMTGAVGVTRADAWSPDLRTGQDDTFPVLDPSVDPQSVAEVKNIDLGTTFTGNLYQGDAKFHVIVKPGENVSGLYLTLQTSSNGIALYTARDTPSAYGIRCAEQILVHPVPNTFTVRCIEPGGQVWPAGDYSLSILIAGIANGSAGSLAQIDLGYSNGSRIAIDTANAYPDPYYRGPLH